MHWSKCQRLSLAAESKSERTSTRPTVKRQNDDGMEILYLLCSILSTFFTSLALSLLLPFRTLLGHRCPSRASSSSSSSDAVSFYEGTVWHDRRRPVRHTFTYPVRYALFDLDHAPHAPSDHLSAAEARRVAETNGPVYTSFNLSPKRLKIVNSNALIRQFYLLTIEQICLKNCFFEQNLRNIYFYFFYFVLEF